MDPGIVGTGTWWPGPSLEGSNILDANFCVAALGSSKTIVNSYVFLMS
jgi:hypothetical protein